MKRIVLAAVAAAAMMTGVSVAQADDSRVQVGRLACDVAPGVGLLFGSSKSLTCEFTRKGHKPETYTGTINKLGIDVGFTAATHIEWLVFAAADSAYTKHALAGTYVGASYEATLGVGLGANWLVGGSKKSFALQPWSVQGQAGLNYSWAFAGLTLK
jgi:hypothetical protein